MKTQDEPIKRGKKAYTPEQWAAIQEKRRLSKEAKNMRGTFNRFYERPEWTTHIERPSLIKFIQNAIESEEGIIALEDKYLNKLNTSDLDITDKARIEYNARRSCWTALDRKGQLRQAYLFLAYLLSGKAGDFWPWFWKDNGLTFAAGRLN